MIDRTKGLIDGVSLSVAIGTLMDALPYIAALFTIVWTGMQILDWIEKRRARKK